MLHLIGHIQVCLKQHEFLLSRLEHMGAVKVAKTDVSHLLQHKRLFGLARKQRFSTERSVGGCKVE